MQTEIDQFLTEQNSLLMQQNNLLAEQNKVLSQQIDSLKTILSDYSEVELSLKSKINNLLAEKEAQQALILTLKSRAFKARTGQLFGAITARISSKSAKPIADAINTNLKSTEFNRHYQQLSANIASTNTKDDHSTANRPTTSSLEALATQSVTNYRRRLRDSEQANSEARDNTWRLNSIDLKVKQLTDLIENIRLEPQPASNFINLRYDGYYPGYIDSHKILTKKQDQAYQSKNHLQLIEFISEKTDNLKKYMLRASSNIRTSDYEQIEKIIKNDDRMLKF